ncbi:hypothetical protein BGY98DRAFT_230991 [Russula aff. rugulosa BPL654]|nr:hypothetical protein BGY98DRAFT_230991 [Russula aff. rugulosa BPL654]
MAYVVHLPFLVMTRTSGVQVQVWTRLGLLLLSTHKNPQPLPYPSSTALQSNGYLSNASFMTSPSHSSFTEVPNDIAEVYPPGHDYLL